MWERIISSSAEDWYKAGATSVEREGWLTYITTANGSWVLIGRTSMTIGYGITSWITVGADDIDADGLHLAVQLCPKRCVAILTVVMRIVEEGRQ